jgi:hypothetical protein
MNVWRFGVVRLWEVEAEAALASGAPDLLALAPLLKGSSPAAVWEAARKIRQICRNRECPSLPILWPPAEGCYNKEQLAQGAIGSGTQMEVKLTEVMKR